MASQDTSPSPLPLPTSFEPERGNLKRTLRKDADELVLVRRRMGDDDDDDVFETCVCP